MNKKELIQAIAEKADMSQVDATRALDSFVEVVTKALKKKQEVRLVGFGTFTTVKRKATMGRNPQTGAPIKIAASTNPKFKPGKALKEAVN